MCVKGFNGVAKGMYPSCMGVGKRDVKGMSIVCLFDNICRTFALFVSDLAFMKKNFISVRKLI